jgi:hypothetical protein
VLATVASAVCIVAISKCYVLLCYCATATTTDVTDDDVAVVSIVIETHLLV